MDMQKIQARADLERMVYNYALLGRIGNDAASKIVSFIGYTIGGGDLPEPQGRVIAFPAAAMIGHAGIPAPPDDSGGEEESPPFPVWLNNFRGAGFEEYNSVGRKILHAMYRDGINSLEELAGTHPDKLRRRGWGYRMFEIIQTVLEKNGFAPCEKWGIAL
jgi:hypothetical protein